MKILVSVSKETGEVFRVETVERHIGRSKSLQTEEDVLNVIKKNNEESGYERFVVREVDGVVEEAFAFLLGEKGYKTTYDLEDVCDRVDEVNNAIESLSTDIYDVEQAVGTIKELVVKLKEKYGNEQTE